MIEIDVAETKNQWARDDPAFLVLLLLFTAVGGLAYGIVAASHSIWGVFRTVLVAELWLLLGGGLIATLSWALANRFLRAPAPPHSVEQEVGEEKERVEERIANPHVRLRFLVQVEWLYAFDVHCNAFVAYFAVAFVAQVRPEGGVILVSRIPLI